MTSNEPWAVAIVLILIHIGSHECSVIKRDGGGVMINGSGVMNPGGSFADATEERNLEREIIQELNHLGARKQRQIFNDLENQKKNLNAPLKTLAQSESENLSPLNVEELKKIRNTIKTSNSSLPAIRNKRTLNFLLQIVARAMGYTLTPTNPDAEWIPRPQPTSAPPCTTPAPPCTPQPPSAPPPCATPPPAPPCTGMSRQPATVPPNQIDANTISYPYRSSRTIPLFNFAPLPPGVRVPYPPLLQPPARQSSACPPCGAAPPPCMPSSTPAPPCGAAAPSPPPCGTTPAPRPLPCRPAPNPPCGTTPAPMPPPCATTPAPPPPCGTTPMPPPPPCGASPAPPPCGNPPLPPPSSQPPKKGSILLEYDDPVRIQIFSNEKKYLPASGSIYSGSDDDRKEDYEEKEEMEEEHLEEEEEEEETKPQQLKHHEEEDEGTSANGEEDESETNLSIVKKPAVEASLAKKDGNGKKAEKSAKTKNPKRKKWVRIVKKQRRKTKTDSSPHNFQNLTVHDNFPGASQTVPKFYGEKNFHTGFDSFEKDVSDYSGDSSADTSADVAHFDLKKLVVNDKTVRLPETGSPYELNINPYALEPEAERRQKIEKAVERYVEDYVEKQLGQELIKNTGVPKTTVFEFAPKNGPKIQTITTTVAKTSRGGNSAAPKFHNKPETYSPYKAPIKKHRSSWLDSHEENLSRRGDASYEAFATRS